MPEYPHGHKCPTCGAEFACTWLNCQNTDAMACDACMEKEFDRETAEEVRDTLAPAEKGADIDWEARLNMRLARLKRLLSLNAPRVVLTAECALVLIAAIWGKEHDPGDGYIGTLERALWERKRRERG